MDHDKVAVHKNPKKKKKRTRHLVQSSSHLNQTSLVNKGCIIERAVYVFSVMTIFCSFLILHCQQHQKIINIILSLLLAVFFLCRIEAGSPSLTRWAHLACSGSQLEHRMRFILPAGTVGNIITHTNVVSPEKYCQFIYKCTSIPMDIWGMHIYKYTWVMRLSGVKFGL